MLDMVLAGTGWWKVCRWVQVPLYKGWAMCGVLCGTGYSGMASSGLGCTFAYTCAGHEKFKSSQTLWTEYPELHPDLENLAFLGCSTRCAGHTEIPNRLSPATGSGATPPSGKREFAQAEERGG